MALTQISTKGIKDGTITGTDLATNVDLVDNQKIRFGAGDDLAIFHDGTDNLLSTVGTVLAVHRGTTNAGNPVFEVRSNHGATNQIKFQVDGDGDVLIPTDTGKLQLGVSQDLNIYHDGSESVIGNNTGTFQFLSPNEIRYRATTHHFLAYGNDESMAKFIDDGAVELYHNDSKRISTTTTGLSVTRQNAGEYLNVNANYRSSGDQAIETSGDLTFYTNGSSIAARLDQDGLKFNGDTAAANGLDDYEEGTFTPALEFTGTTNISYSGSSRNAEYVKVGNLVYIRLFVNGTSSGTNTGQLKVTGLPFTPNSGGYGRHACSVQAGGLSLSSGEAGAFGLIEESEAKIDVYAGSTAGVNVTISAAKWNNSGFYIAGTYHILGY